MGTTRRNIHLLVGFLGTYYHEMQIVRVDAFHTGQMLVVEMHYEGNFTVKAAQEGREVFRKAVAKVAECNQLAKPEESNRPTRFTFVVTPETEVSGLVSDVCDTANQLIPVFRVTRFIYGSVHLSQEESTQDAM